MGFCFLLKLVVFVRWRKQQTVGVASDAVL